MLQCQWFEVVHTSPVRHESLSRVECGTRRDMLWFLAMLGDAPGSGGPMFNGSGNCSPPLRLMTLAPPHMAEFKVSFLSSAGMGKQSPMWCSEKG